MPLSNSRTAMMVHQMLNYGRMVLLVLGLSQVDLWAAEPPGNSQLNLQPQVMTRIPPGTSVGEQNANGWNRLVLFAKPRLAAGAVDKIPRLARSYATRFNVVIMAQVSRTEDATKQYRLDRVGVGFCTQIDGKQIVISSETQERLGADLDTIERIVLEQNEKVLEGMVRIARSDGITLFDVEALVLHENEHRDMLIRHLVWASRESGKVAVLLWPLLENSQSRYKLAGESLVALPGGFHEDRIIHVSDDEIKLGIPTTRAFALAGMPRGKKLACTPELTQLVTLKRYTPTTLAKLVQTIKRAF